VLTDLEDSQLVPRSILFWRSETHFLGGLGIMVLFVAILGMGSAGKALMQAEMPGPSQESPHTRMQRAAWAFALIYVGLTLVLTVLLVLQGLSYFDSLCHAFGTIATGGFSTYNKSVEYFQSVGVETTITVFMILACTNFTLLYYLALLKPGKLLGDAEFRTYLAIMFVVTALVVGSGLNSGDFTDFGSAVRYGSFQVASIMTNTGFGTCDFDRWNSLSRALLLLLMFIGGCAGSTSCSIKVIRHIFFVKILWLELEKIFHPSVVRPVRLGGKPAETPELRMDILIYFGMILLIFIAGWITLVAIEPDRTWIEDGRSTRDKLIDCASAVAATLNGVGPGLGVVGESENYAHFHTGSKFVLIWMMLLGRLEVFVILALFVPRFWRSR
jgi:trk system potassium uptake protein TrkH